MKLVNPRNVQIWSNPVIRLYHGTDIDSVGSILRGIEIEELRDSSDFGRGFYTTTNLAQAEIWASGRAKRKRRNPAVIELVMSRDELAALESLWFVRADKNAEDFWNLVRACVDNGETNRGENATYDLVVGPVSRGFRTRRVWENYDQVSFHTHRAFDVLNNSKKARL